MERVLGRSGIKVSAVGLGTARIGGLGYSRSGDHDLASVNKIPLVTGVLTGRWGPDTKLPADDRRSDWFADEGFRDALSRAETLRPILTENGRRYVQGALGWILARSPRAIPIPGFRTVEQVEGIAGALAHGPLRPEQMAAIDELLERS